VTELLIAVAVAIAALVLVALHRAARGPSTPDRLLGVALAAANSVVLLLVLGLVYDRVDMFVDIALAYALLAFLFPVAFAKHLEKEGRER
jgi:multicomponent Na+:H+ antiporter subunit F